VGEYAKAGVGGAQADSKQFALDADF